MKTIASIALLSLFSMSNASAAEYRNVGASSVVSKPGWGRASVQAPRPESVRAREAAASEVRPPVRFGKLGWQRAR